MRYRSVLPFLVAATVASAALAADPSESYKGRVKPGDLPASVDRDEAESPLGRIEWMKERMGGELSPTLRTLILDEAARLQSTSSPSSGTWQPLGPTNITRFQNGVNKAKDNNGRLRTILADPRAAGTVFVLASGGGLWKTTNFGASNPNWVPKTDGIYATAGGGAAFGRTPDVIYLGSGDPFDLGVGGIMYKSTDGGDHWSSPIVLPGAARILDVKVDTSVGSTTADDIVLVGTDVGLYRSTNGGASFSYVTIDPGLHALLASFGIPGVESWSLARSSAGWLVAETYWATCSNCFELTAIYYSTDRGATWTVIPDPGDLGSDLANGLWAGRVTLTAAGPGNGIVYALAAENDGGNQRDIYRSTDGGLNFARLNVNTKVPTNPTPYNPNMNLMHGQAWYNHMILADTTDATGNTLYAGGNYSSAVSRDGGNTWTLLTNWLGNLPLGGGPGIQLPYAHADFHCAALSTAGGKKRLFFGNDGGIFYSDDNGKSWNDNANEGIQTSLIYSLAVGTKHTEDTLIGLQDNGTLFRVGQSTAYTGSIGGDGFGTGWSQANDDVSMGSLYFLDIRRWLSNPPNNQAKYDRLLNTSNLAGPGNAWYLDSYFVTPIATPSASSDPTGHVFYTNTQRYLLKTSDGGDSWSAIWTSPPPGTRMVRAVSHGIGLAPDDQNNIALAGTSSRVMITHDGGATWTETNIATQVAGWPGFNSTAGWGRDTHVVYVANEDTTNTPHVARSADGGATFSNATGNLPRLPVNKLVVDPSDATGNTVYVANWIGVYRTTDAGAHWSAVGSGLPLAMISDLYLAPDGSFLRVSSYGRGVWQLGVN